MQLKKLYKITLYMTGALVLAISSYFFSSPSQGNGVKSTLSSVSDLLLPDAKADITGGDGFSDGFSGDGDCGDIGDGGCGP